MKQPSFKTDLTLGLMLFALFFGAGNLIFPAFLGIYAGENLWTAIIGFCLTAVTLPLLGVVAIAYTGADDAESISRPVSKAYALFFSVALYLSIGPFFAIPRTGATSYAVGIEPIFGSSFLVKALYALVFFGLSYWLAVRPSKIADRIGKYLTPILLLVLAVLVLASFIRPADRMGLAYNAGEGVSNAFADLPFVAGLIQGYGTLDALASLAFSIVVIQSAKSFGASSNQAIAKKVVRAGVIASILLGIIYVFVARIGATSQSLFDHVAGQFQFKGVAIDGSHVLTQAASFYLGGIGQAVLGTVIFLACLTTATGLIAACAGCFHKLFPRVSHAIWAGLFTLVATAFYFGGLSEIIKWSVPVLYLLYPLTVAIIFLSLTKSIFKGSQKVYAWTIGLTFVAGLYDALSTFSGMTGLFTLPVWVVDFFTKTLPLGAYAMGWVPLALLGFVIGLLHSQFSKD